MNSTPTHAHSYLGDVDELECGQMMLEEGVEYRVPSIYRQGGAELSFFESSFDFIR